MQFMFWVWLAVLIASIIVELATMGLTSIWFALGALIAMILAIFEGVAWYVQLPVFVFVSLISLLSLKKVVKKWLFKNAGSKTNADSLIGRKVKLLKTADGENLGEVKIGDVIWSASPKDLTTTFLEGEHAVIVEINGNKLMLEKINKE